MIPTSIKRLGETLEAVRRDGVMADEAADFASDMAEALRRMEGVCAEARDAVHYADMAQLKARAALDKAELARIALVKLFDRSSAEAIEQARDYDNRRASK
jgi:vacuolar-type H+-ATPase catalytic subunit A/Vma1